MTGFSVASMVGLLGLAAQQPQPGDRLGLRGRAGPARREGAGHLAGAHGAALTVTPGHTAAYLLVTGAMATLLYHRLGLRVLRTAWINLDLVWSADLVVTAAATAPS